MPAELERASGKIQVPQMSGLILILEGNNECKEGSYLPVDLHISICETPPCIHYTPDADMQINWQIRVAQVSGISVIVCPVLCKLHSVMQETLAPRIQISDMSAVDYQTRDEPEHKVERNLLKQTQNIFESHDSLHAHDSSGHRAKSIGT